MFSVATPEQVTAARNKTWEELRQLLVRETVLPGSYRLPSGETSRYYVDVRRISCNSDGARLIGSVLAWEIETLVGAEHECVHGVGGAAFPAIPLITATTPALRYYTGHDVYGFWIRKEHGTRRQMEGRHPAPGDRVVIVEDVVTTGYSALDTARAAKALGAQVLGVIALVGRDDYGDPRQLFHEAGLPYRFVYSQEDLGLTS